MHFSSVLNPCQSYSTIANSPTPTVPDGNCIPCPFDETAPALTPLVAIVNDVRSLQPCPPVNGAPEKLPRNRKAPEGSHAALCTESLIGAATPICDSAPLDESTAKARTLLTASIPP